MTHLTTKEIIYYNWPWVLWVAIFLGWFVSLFCITPVPSPEYIVFGYFAILFAGVPMMGALNYIEHGKLQKETLLCLGALLCVMYLILGCAGRGCRYRTSV